MQVRRAKPQQAGFFLLELTIGVAILGVAVLAMYSAISSLNQMERGKRVGHQYALINEAMGQYMATHYKQLKSLNPNCSQHSLGRLISKARPVISAASASLKWPKKRCACIKPHSAMIHYYSMRSMQVANMPSVCAAKIIYGRRTRLPNSSTPRAAITSTPIKNMRN